MHRVTRRWIVLIAAVVAITALSSQLNGQTKIRPAAPRTGTAAASQAKGSGWKVSTDNTGLCRVSAPPQWQLGRDFFLEREEKAMSPISRSSEKFVPAGLAMWKIDHQDPEKLAQLTPGTRYQFRFSVDEGDAVCSMWRIKESRNFTAEELATIRAVGKTLEVVR